MQVQRDLEALGLSAKCVNQLWFRMELRGSLERVQQQLSGRRPSEAARQALHELTVVTEYAERLGVTLPMVVYPGECGRSRRTCGGGSVPVNPARHGWNLLGNERVGMAI